MNNSEVYYRKYRPSNFVSLIGQDTIKKILINSILNNQIAHSYIFTGARGTGKTTTARLFAKAINCSNFRDNDVCNECENCKLINSSATNDIVEIDAASNRSIEDVRSLRETVNFSPSVLKYKVYIIDEVHMLTKEAFNALLKTLEEPPSHCVFILATTELFKVPTTILSRCIKLTFSLLDESSLVSKIRDIASREGLEIDQESLDIIYKVSQGSMRDAESLFQKLASTNKKIDAELTRDILGLSSNDLIKNFVSNLINYNQASLIGILDDLSKNVFDLKSFLEQSLEFYINEFTDNNRSLLNFFTESIINIDRFVNKYVFLKAKIIELESSIFVSIDSKEKSFALTKQSQTAIQKVTNTSQDENIKQGGSQKIDQSGAFEKQSENSTNDQISLTKFTQDLADFLKGFDDRLAAIIKASRITEKDNKINIYHKYKFNLNYVKQIESLTKITEFILKTFGRGYQVEILLDKDNPDDTEILQKTQSQNLVRDNIKTDKNIELEEDKKLLSSAEEIKSLPQDSKILDNSDIINSIF